VVSSQSQGGSAMVVGDDFAVAHHQQGQVNVATVDVVKCRNCNTLLNPKKDYLYTAEEQRGINAKEQEDFENKKRAARNWGAASSIISTIGLFIFTTTEGNFSLIPQLVCPLLGGSFIGLMVWIIATPKNLVTTFGPSR
jgi:hypothetical protein